jgi:hypothetical protein
MTLAPDRFEKPENIGGGAAPSEIPDETTRALEEELTFEVVAVYVAKVVGRRTDAQPDITVSEVSLYRKDEEGPIIKVSPGGPPGMPFASLDMATAALRGAIFFRWDDVHADLSLLQTNYSEPEVSSEHEDWRVKPED